MVVGGRYTLRAAVGHGGMGTVWRATDTQLRREVAVKEVVPPDGIAADDRDAMYERLLREGRAAAGLSHPAIVQVYDVVTYAGRPWVVMELLDARSLATMVLEDGPLAARAVAKVGVALLGALEVAHAAGVLHRDVKPANVLICTDGRCVLTDFGVARLPTDQQLTTPGMVLGSPHFISPERALGASFGPPSDLFSLGVTLYLAVEGQPPFDKGEPIATMHAVVEDQPRPPLRAGPLCDVLSGLLTKDPARRWDTAITRNALRELLAGPLRAGTDPRFPTDPYAVVQARPPAATTEQVGGRALLAPAGDPYQTLPDAYAQVPDAYRTNGHPALPADPKGRRLVTARRRSMLVAFAATLAGLVLLASVLLFINRADGPPTDPATVPAGPDPTTVAPDELPFEVQQYAGRGLVVNLPAQWQGIDNPALVYVDYIDPADATTAVRLLVESWSGDAQRLVEVAEESIRTSNACADPYQRVSLTEIEVAGAPAALLEYTCGEGVEMRRARWATVVQDGTAYSFRLKTRDSEFGQREAIFDELVRSFQITG